MGSAIHQDFYEGEGKADLGGARSIQEEEADMVEER
jgi:hypothetical protein